MSFNRNRAGDSDCQRVIFHAVVGTGKDAKRAEKPLTWREVIDLWRTSTDFRDVFIEALNEEWCYGCEDYYWECAPVVTDSLDNKLELVVKDKGWSDRNGGGRGRDGPETFKAHFAVAREKGKEIAVFNNLGGDAVLVAPVQGAQGSDAGETLGSFANYAPTKLKHDLFVSLGNEIHKRVSSKPIWVSTNGDGVAWLQVRLDSKPKYYTYSPYKKLLLNGYDEAVKKEAGPQYGDPGYEAMMKRTYAPSDDIYE